MAKFTKVLIGSAKCVWGVAYGGLAIAAKAITGPLSKLQPELQKDDIVDTVSFLVNSGVDDIREGIND